MIINIILYPGDGEVFSRTAFDRAKNKPVFVTKGSKRFEGEILNVAVDHQGGHWASLTVEVPD